MEMKKKKKKMKSPYWSKGPVMGKRLGTTLLEKGPTAWKWMEKAKRKTDPKGDDVMRRKWDRHKKSARRGN